MNAPYLTCALGSAAVFVLMDLLRVRAAGLPVKAWLLPLLCGGALCVLMARGCYLAAFAESQFARYGAAALLRLEPRELSIVGGGLGLSLGIWLGAHWAGVRGAACLDAMAPAGLLLTAGLRAAECWQGSLGLGLLVTDEFAAFRRFPFAAANAYQEWYWSVFLLECLLALVTALVFLRRKAEPLPGLTFERAVFALCAPQILCENLRAVCMRWGFVRIEQVACAVIVLALLFRSCRKTAGLRSLWERYWPCAAWLAGVGVIIVMEFGLDNKLPIPNPLCWLGILAAIGLAFWLEHKAVRRRKAMPLGSPAHGVR